MSLPSLVNVSQRPGISTLEKAADIFLTPSKVMWFGKRVTLVRTPNSNEYKIEGKTSKTVNSRIRRAVSTEAGAHAVALGFLFLAPLYVISSVVSAILLGIGLAMKAPTIKNDKVAQAERKVFDHYQPFQKADSELKKLQEKINLIQKELTKLKKIEEEYKNSNEKNSNSTSNPYLHIHEQNQKTIEQLKSEKTKLPKAIAKTTKKVDALREKLIASVQSYHEAAGGKGKVTLSL